MTASSHARGDKCSNCDVYVTCVDVYFFSSTVLELNWCCAIRISEGTRFDLKRFCYMTLSLLLFGTNCVVCKHRVLEFELFTSMNEDFFYYYSQKK